MAWIQGAPAKPVTDAGPGRYSRPYLIEWNDYLGYLDVLQWVSVPKIRGSGYRWSLSLKGDHDIRLEVILKYLPLGDDALASYQEMMGGECVK